MSRYICINDYFCMWFNPISFLLHSPSSYSVAGWELRDRICVSVSVSDTVGHNNYLLDLRLKNLMKICRRAYFLSIYLSFNSVLVNWYFFTCCGIWMSWVQSHVMMDTYCRKIQNLNKKGIQYSFLFSVILYLVSLLDENCF